ncbi:MAG: TonB-dependent receptor [Gemmatimonadota bacterium]
MRREPRRLSCLILLALLPAFVPATATAQDTGGSLFGRVVSVDGGPLAGAAIEVSGASLPGIRYVETGPSGHFRLTGLPGGIYIVEISQLGFRTLRWEDVRVSIGQSTSPGGGDIVLESSAIEVAPLVVETERPVLDVGTAALETSLTAHEFLEIPTERDYRDLIKLAPQANPSFIGDPVNVAGATGLENLTYIDGLNVTDPFVGGLGTKLPYNFVKEFQVKTGGYEAEYGGAGGGIFNVVTQSGSNAWSFSGFGYVNTAGLTADAQLGVGELVSRGADSYDFGVAVGGPILRDRLWFFASYDPTFSSAEVEIPGHGYFDDERTEHLFAGKLTWRAGPSTDVVATFFGDPTTYDRVGGGPFSGDVTQILDPDVFLNRIERGGYNAGLDLTHRFASSAVLDIALGGQWTQNFDGPRPGDDEARYTCLGANGCDGLIPGATSGGFGELFAFNGRRLSARLSGTFFLGSHTAKAGFEFEESALSPFEARNPGVGVILDLGPEAGAFRWLVVVQERVATLKSRVPTAYVQDSWAIADRFRLNYGLRWEGHQIVDSEGSAAQSISDQWQPRLGFVWQPGSPGSQKISGSAGRFYQRMPLRLLTSWYSGSEDATNYTVFYDGDPRSSGQPIEGTEDVFCCTIEPERDLDGTHYDELSLGYERVLGTNVRVGARGIYRTLREVINLGSSFEPSGPLQVGNPGRGDLDVLEDPEREYLALELTLEWLADENLRASASYVLSRTEGNFPGIYQSDGGFLFPNENGVFQQPFQMENNDGLLPNDRPHVFKLWGSYRFDFGLSAGTFLSVQSGVPESRYLAFFGNSIAFRSPRGSEGRTPTLWDLNFRLEYPIRLGGSRGWRANLVADFLHVGNPQEVGLYEQVEAYAGELGDVPNPTYREPIAFQDPFTVRFGLAVGF